MDINLLKLQRDNVALKIEVLNLRNQVNDLVADNLARAGQQLDAAITAMEKAEEAKQAEAEKTAAADAERAGV